jgi:threonine/homoserine/homoserine lactone efflux protein
MLEFALAVFFLIVTPGPGVLSTAGVGAAYGVRPGLAYVAGLFLGTNLVALAVVSGLAAAALAVPWLRAVLLWGSAAYLLWLAARIALAGAKIAFIHPERPPGALAGVALQVINPKAYAVNTALFSGFPASIALTIRNLRLKRRIRRHFGKEILQKSAFQARNTVSHRPTLR